MDHAITLEVILCDRRHSRGGACSSAMAADTETAWSGDQIQEIIVTAQRRSENIQNVPIAIQALTGETLTS